MTGEIAVIDYGAGNIRSVINAIRWFGFEPRVAASPADLAAARAVILPGVGAAADTMKSLELTGMAAAIQRLITAGRPFLGICIGLQVLLSFSEEGDCECLGIVPGRVKRLPAGLKVPHMGWNQVKQKLSHPVFDGIPDGANFYFVHSYYVEPEDGSLVAGETDYGVTMCSIVVRENLIGTQFHPEKSGDVGLRLYRNFFKIAGLNPAGGGGGLRC